VAERASLSAIRAWPAAVGGIKKRQIARLSLQFAAAGLATGAEARKGRAASCVQALQHCRPAPMVYAASHLCSDKPRNHDERPEMDQRLSGMSGNHRVALDANSTAIAGDATAAFARARLTDEAEIRSTNRESRYGCRRSDVVRASCASRSRTADCEREIRPCFSGSRHPDGLPLSGKLIRLNRLKPWRVGRLAPIPHLEGTRGRACCS
jgi:hypothetical protein